ncbi:hypothetical protein WG78_01735 [Amantichitinum ursilacus]|uniref:Uncharacterized protein n=2 Tax=Amantichitinum ursilacus TaxID=857265 RepID=A0A0N0GR52_9NEIS|nr:hypothetical protein WG78_01735 [Amantichitinum ursilacus]
MHPLYLIWMASLVIALVTSLAGVWLARTKWLELQHDRQLYARLLQIPHVKPSPLYASATPTFLNELPTRFGEEKFIASLNEVALKQKAQLIEVSVQRTPASENRLPRVELDARLRGTYPAIKAVLATALQAYPGLAIEHLSMRNAGLASSAGTMAVGATGPAATTGLAGTLQQEASVHLSQWLRPTDAASGVQ